MRYSSVFAIYETNFLFFIRNDAEPPAFFHNAVYSLAMRLTMPISAYQGAKRELGTGRASGGHFTCV